MEQDTEELSEPLVLRKYFGTKPYKDKTGIAALMLEIKELTAADRLELAELAAKELGVKLKHKEN